MDEIKIGHVLKHLMNDRKLTFKKLSELSGVPLSTIKTWSAGVEPKSLAHARKVSRALGVSVEYLVFGNAEGNQPNLQDILTTQLFSGWCKITIELPATTPIAKIKKDIQDGVE